MVVVSRYGLVAFASSLDQIGPLTRDVRDNAWCCKRHLPGTDSRDATSLVRAGTTPSEAIEAGVKGMRDRPARGVFWRGR